MKAYVSSYLTRDGKLRPEMDDACVVALKGKIRNFTAFVWTFHYAQDFRLQLDGYYPHWVHQHSVRGTPRAKRVR